MPAKTSHSFVIMFESVPGYALQTYAPAPELQPSSSHATEGASSVHRLHLAYEFHRSYMTRSILIKSLAQRA